MVPCDRCGGVARTRFSLPDARVCHDCLKRDVGVPVRPARVTLPDEIVRLARVVDGLPGLSPTTAPRRLAAAVLEIAGARA